MTTFHSPTALQMLRLTLSVLGMLMATSQMLEVLSAMSLSMVLLMMPSWLTPMALIFPGMFTTSRIVALQMKSRTCKFAISDCRCGIIQRPLTKDQTKRKSGARATTHSEWNGHGFVRLISGSSTSTRTGIHWWSIRQGQRRTESLLVRQRYCRMPFLIQISSGVARMQECHSSVA